MPRAALVTLPLAAALAASAIAAPEPPVRLRKAFGATILSTYPDGRTARLWLQPDGDYTAAGRRGDPSSGHWRISKDRICLKQKKPWSPPFSYCTPLPSGETWSAKAVTGEQIQVRIVPGRG
jgi:hypothetical protein